MVRKASFDSKTDPNHIAGDKRHSEMRCKQTFCPRTRMLRRNRPGRAASSAPGSQSNELPVDGNKLLMDAVLLRTLSKTHLRNYENARNRDTDGVENASLPIAAQEIKPGQPRASDAWEANSH